MTKRINISFDKKSINNAIKELNAMQKKLQEEIPPLFLRACLEETEMRANANLMATNVSPAIKSTIIGGWSKEVVGNTAKLVNSSDKAVFIEFGVGVVGQESPHPNSDEANYEYNINSYSKQSDGTWFFKNDSWLGSDIMDNYILQTRYYGNAEIIETKGQPAQLYLFNAFMDMKTRGRYQAIWEETLDKYL